MTHTGQATGEDLENEGRASPVNIAMSNNNTYYGCSISKHCERGQKIAMCPNADDCVTDVSPTRYAMVNIDWKVGLTKTSYIGGTDVKLVWTPNGAHDVKKFPDKAAFDACEFERASATRSTLSCVLVCNMDGRQTPKNTQTRGTRSIIGRRGCHRCRVAVAC